MLASGLPRCEPRIVMDEGAPGHEEGGGKWGGSVKIFRGPRRNPRGIHGVRLSVPRTRVARGSLSCVILRRADIFNICARGAGKVGALLYLYVMYDSRDMRFPRDIVEARG